MWNLQSYPTALNERMWHFWAYWPLLHIFRGSGPPTHDLRPAWYWLVGDVWRFRTAAGTFVQSCRHHAEVPMVCCMSPRPRTAFSTAHCRTSWPSTKNCVLHGSLQDKLTIHQEQRSPRLTAGQVDHPPRTAFSTAHCRTSWPSTKNCVSTAHCRTSWPPTKNCVLHGSLQDKLTIHQELRSTRLTAGQDDHCHRRESHAPQTLQSRSSDYLLSLFLVWCPFSAVTPLFGRQEGHSAYEKSCFSNLNVLMWRPVRDPDYLGVISV